MRLRHERRRAAAIASLQAWAEIGETYRRVIGPVVESLREIGRSPVMLDLRMATGGYEEDLAESHGDAEDVFH